MNNLAKVNYTSYSSVECEESTFFDAPNETGTPERRLLLAMLERAILDFVGNDKREMEEADEWLFGDEDSENDENSKRIFTFKWICQELDLNMVKIALKIKNMPKRGDKRVPPWYFMKTKNIQKSIE